PRTHRDARQGRPHDLRRHRTGGATLRAANRRCHMSETRLIIPALGPLYRPLSCVPITLVRIMSGASLAAPGYPKLFGNTAAQAKFFASAGFEPAMFWTILTGCVEFFGGLCLAVGLATRLVCVPILIF